MGQPRPPQPVKLIVGMLGPDASLLERVEAEMQVLWGGIDIRSAVMPFTHTNYYAKEMGELLWRKFVSFTELIDPGRLAAIKHQSNALEKRYAEGYTKKRPGLIRPINLDPGYIEPSKLVLATTKNYSHRIYIGAEMYAEVTLHYHKESWRPWPYTYPDYAGGDYYDFLNRARRNLMESL